MRPRRSARPDVLRGLRLADLRGRRGRDPQRLQHPPGNRPTTGPACPKGADLVKLRPGLAQRPGRGSENREARVTRPLARTDLRLQALNIKIPR